MKRHEGRGTCLRRIISLIILVSRVHLSGFQAYWVVPETWLGSGSAAHLLRQSEQRVHTVRLALTSLTYLPPSLVLRSLIFFRHGSCDRYPAVRRWIQLHGPLRGVSPTLGGVWFCFSTFPFLLCTSVRRTDGPHGVWHRFAVECYSEASAVCR